jgi:type II secretion system protein N
MRLPAMKIDWSAWKPRLLYGAFFLVALLLALRWTFPSEAVLERISVEAAARGWQLQAAEAGPAGLIGLSLREVTLKDRAGLTIPLDRVDLTLPLWPLLTGRRRVAVDAWLYDGRARGTFDLAAGPREYRAALEGIDLARALPLRMALGVDLAGLATGTARLSFPADEKATPVGQLSLAVKEAGLTGGKIDVPGAGALTLPAVKLGELAVELVLKDGKGSFEKLAATGGDVELAGEGLYFAWQPRLEFAPLFGKARLRLTPAFSSRPENRGLASLLDAALVGARSGEGTYGLQIYGSLGHPQVRPAGAAVPSPRPDTE